ncbi:MAG: peptidase T [Flavobacteriales bacterium]|nr:peptidase T [Flavobacteriales bacterium]
MNNLVNRFLHYVSFDTQSEFDVETIPSTKKQFDLANYIKDELEGIGMDDVSIDENGYIMATLPSNIDKDVPTIGFVAHYDTSPDFSGANIKPNIRINYDGKKVVLNEELGIEMSIEEFPELVQYKGQTLITTDGTTLLGADDKAGIAEIITAMEEMIADDTIKHGKIRIGFTPDEEVGRGADLFDVKKFGAEWAYTMDGSEIGELEYENFNAAGAKVTFTGKIVHPGYALNKMVNSMTRAAEFIQSMPEHEVPEHTTKYEGFYHLMSVKGEVEDTTLQYIIRDHDRELFENRKEFMLQQVEGFKQKYGDKSVSIDMKDQYYNMREMVVPQMHIVDIAEQAMKNLDIKPNIKAIRGGTDGSRLSYMGLPCPNIFAGGHNFHGRYEFVPIESMMKAKDVILEIAKITAER